MKIKRLLLISGIAILSIAIFLTVILGLAIQFIDAGESYGWQLRSDEQDIAQQLYNYQKIHNGFPSSLSEAGIQNKTCHNNWFDWLTFTKCAEVKYKPSEDKQSFTLAAADGEGFIAYYNWDYGLAEKYGIHTVNGEISSLAITGELAKQRNDFPIYREKSEIFATPSAWPVIESK